MTLTLKDLERDYDNQDFNLDELDQELVDNDAWLKLMNSNYRVFFWGEEFSYLLKSGAFCRLGDYISILAGDEFDFSIEAIAILAMLKLWDEPTARIVYGVSHDTSSSCCWAEFQCNDIWYVVDSATLFKKRRLAYASKVFRTLSSCSGDFELTRITQAEFRNIESMRILHGILQNRHNSGYWPELRITNLVIPEKAKVMSGIVKIQHNIDNMFIYFGADESQAGFYAIDQQIINYCATMRPLSEIAEMALRKVILSSFDED